MKILRPAAIHNHLGITTFLMAGVFLFGTILSATADNYTIQISAAQPAPIILDGNSLNDVLTADVIDTTRGIEATLSNATWTWTLSSTYSSTMSGSYGNLPANNPGFCWSPSNSPSASRFVSSSTSNPLTANLAGTTHISPPKASETTGGYYNIAIHVHVDFTDQFAFPQQASGDGDITIQATVLEPLLIGPNTNTVAGEQISLSINYLPSDLFQPPYASPTENWTVPGSVVKNFDPSNQAPWTDNYADLSDMTIDPIVFYWYDSGNNREVDCKVGFGGSTTTAKAFYTTWKPTGTTDNPTFGSVYVGSYLTNPTKADDTPYLSLGHPYRILNTTTNITTDYSGIVHNFGGLNNFPQGIAGVYEWVQVTTGAVCNAHSPSVGAPPPNNWYIYESSQMTPYELDATYPYTSPITNGTNFAAGDAPAMPIGDNVIAVNGQYAPLDEARVSEGFRDWLMFKPTQVNGTPLSGQIYVPIGNLSWKWSARATKSGGTWVIDNSYPGPSLTQNYTENGVTFPRWNHNLKFDPLFENPTPSSNPK